MTDLLNIEFINGLPQPFMAELYSGDEWEVDSICVETGCMSILVCGLLQNLHISEVNYFRDMNGNKHDVDSFYSDYVPEETP